MNAAAAPIPQGVPPVELTSFDRAGTLVEEFERALLDLEIRVAPRSDLETICLDVLDLEAKRLGRSPRNPRLDIRSMFRRGGSLVQFIQLFLRAHEARRLEPFLPHLQLLNRAVVAQSEATPANATPPPIFEASNKVFELFLALVCVPISTDIQLDPPDGAMGDNPDVMPTIEGRRWGFACKIPSGHSPFTFFDRLAEGARQIDRSPAELGIVVTNLKGAIDHTAAWPMTNPEEFRRGEEPLFWCDSDETRVAAYLRDLLFQRRDGVVIANGQPALDDLFRASRCCLPGSLALMQTGAGIEKDGIQLPSLVGSLQVMEFGRIAADAWRIFDLMNQVLHNRI